MKTSFKIIFIKKNFFQDLFLHDKYQYLKCFLKQNKEQQYCALYLASFY